MDVYHTDTIVKRLNDKHITDTQMLDITIKDKSNEENKSSVKKFKKKKIRCVVCNKKLGINPFVCKCEQNFCGLHRHPESHKCTYNFKEEGLKKLYKNLVKVGPTKIAVI